MEVRIGFIICLGAVIHSHPVTAQVRQASADGQIRGVVRDNAGSPLAGVEITTRTTGARSTTDQRGQFEIVGVGSGVHIIVARRLGFRAESLSVPLGAADTADADLVLRPRQVELSEMEITASLPLAARLEGFEHRRSRRSGGQFISREQIERRGSIATADLLRGVPGIKMVDSMGVTIAISSRGAKTTLSAKQVEACVVRVGVDGLIKDPTFGINSMPPGDIHGIEVYAGPATVPPEFNSSAGRNAQCGLIMIWTRSR